MTYPHDQCPECDSALAEDGSCRRCLAQTGIVLRCQGCGTLPVVLYVEDGYIATDCECPFAWCPCLDCCATSDVTAAEKRAERAAARARADFWEAQFLVAREPMRRCAKRQRARAERRLAGALVRRECVEQRVAA